MKLRLMVVHIDGVAGGVAIHLEEGDKLSWFAMNTEPFNSKSILKEVTKRIKLRANYKDASYLLLEDDGRILDHESIHWIGYFDSAKEMVNWLSMQNMLGLLTDETLTTMTK